MTDVLDAAKAFEIRDRETAIANQLNQKTPKPNVIDGIRYCLDCDEEITKARINAQPKAALCVDCQELSEQRGRQWNG